MDTIEDMTMEDSRKEYCTLKELYLKLQEDFEVQSQQLYDYKRELIRLKTLETEYLSEIDALQSGEMKECEKLKLKIQNLEDEKNELKHSYEERIEYIEQDVVKKEGEISKLQEELKLLSVNSQTEDESEVVELRAKNTELQNTIHDFVNERMLLTDKVESLEKEQLLCQEQNNDLRNHLDILNENYNCKKFEITEAKILIETLQEDLFLTKNELDAAKTKPLQDGSQGNSLFSEVDDKRIEMQDRMALMKTQYVEMKQERGKLLSQIAALNCSNSMLCQRWETEKRDRENDDERMEDSYKARIDYLETQIEAYKNEISTRQKIHATNLDSGEIEFMENMLQSKNKEVEKLKQEGNNLSLSRMLLSRQLRDSNIEMRSWRAKTAKLESDVGKLQAEMEELQLKKINENDSNPAKPGRCAMCLRNKKSLAQTTAARPKLKDLVESLDRASLALTGEDHFSMVDCSRQIKRSLLKEPNQTDQRETINTSENNKENVVTEGETKPANNVQRRVQFVDGTLDNSDTNKNKVRKGGKVILCKPMVLKKKC